MIRKPIFPALSGIPEMFHPLLTGTPVYDSSCSPDARVLYLDRDGGLYLKTAGKEVLKPEAEMDAYFHTLGLGPEVLCYHSGETDWLLTRAIPGEDCIHPEYLADPKRLAETMAEILFDLHNRDPRGCPIQAHTRRYLRTIRENHAAGQFDLSFFPEELGPASADTAWKLVQANAPFLKSDTLLHGDFCLPNIMLDAWHFSGFIDLGQAGVGDKHIDLFWGAWTLKYNLKTDCYRSYFLDAYGANHFEPDLLPIIGAFEVFG